MAKQTINIGTTANDGTGDPLRVAFDKANDNFNELYQWFNNATIANADRAVITNDSGYLTTSGVTSTELGYLSGVTSAIQDQIDDKQDADAQLTSIAGLTPGAEGRMITSDGLGGYQISSPGDVRGYLNVEDGADATDTANVTSAGALMDSEVADLAGIKSLDTSTLQVKPIEGAFVDGDKTKLDGIETGATADQSDGEIEIAYNNQVSVVSQLEAEAGTSTTVRRWTAERVKQAIAALAAGGGDMFAATYDPNTVAGDAFDMDNMVEGTTTKIMTAAERTKLSGVESNADVTDETNVVSALSGATLSDAGTPQATDKVLVQDASDSDNLKYVDFADFSSGATVDVVSNVANDRILGRISGGSGDSEELTAAQVRTLINVEDGAEVNVVDSVNSQTGAVVLDADDIDDTSTTNKFATAAELSKLSGIEDGATADQTGAEIKAAYEAEADTNAFTDAEKSKLFGISPGADVTSTANVTSAGALMDSEVTNLNDVKNFDPADYAAASHTHTLSQVTDSGALAALDTVDTAQIDNDAVTYAKMQNISGERLLGRNNGTAGIIEELTYAQVRTALNVEDGAEANPTTQKFALGIACSDETTALTTGGAKATFRMPYAMTLTEVRASVTTAPTGSPLTVDINESGTTILSTKLTIDATEKTSETAATAAVISDSSLADDAEITIDIDQIGSTVAGAGLKVWLIGTISA
jgi:hypothetical protein